MSRRRGWKVGDRIVCIRDSCSDLKIGKTYTLLAQHYEYKIRWVEVDYLEGWGTHPNQHVPHKYYEKARFTTLSEYRKIKLQKIDEA